MHAVFHASCGYWPGYNAPFASPGGTSFRALNFASAMQKQVARSRHRTWLVPWVPMVAAAAAMVLLVLLWVGHRQTSDTIGEMADLHVNALASANQVDVVSTDRHTVKPWFQGKIPFTFNLPEFSGTDFTLVGGRLVYFHQQPGAQLIVSMRQHKISVLIFHGPRT